MSVATVITHGYGSFGSHSFVITIGYGSSDAIDTTVEFICIDEAYLEVPSATAYLEVPSATAYLEVPSATGYMRPC